MITYLFLCWLMATACPAGYLEPRTTTCTCDYSLLWRSYRTESSMTSVTKSLLTLCMTVGCFTTAMTASGNPRLNRVSTRRCCTFMQQVSHCLYALTLTSRHNHAVQTLRLTCCLILFAEQELAHHLIVHNDNYMNWPMTQ